MKPEELKTKILELSNAYDWAAIAETFQTGNQQWHEAEWKAFITELKAQTAREILELIDERVKLSEAALKGASDVMLSGEESIELNIEEATQMYRRNLARVLELDQVSSAIHAKYLGETK